MSSTRLFLASAIAAALLPFTGCKPEDETLTHGFVKLEMRRGESQASDPFIGTATVNATMAYRECLIGFYEANPGLKQSGPEGGEIFGTEDLGGEGWTDRLCELGQVPAQASCTVASMEQTLETNVKQLSIEYAITDTLENHVLLFGPLPTKETAGCDNPVVRVAATGAIKGYNGEGGEIWITESASPTEAITGQGGSITVRAARSDE